MTAKEKAEASVGLLYVKVPHRKIMCADMREFVAPEMG